MSRVDVSLCEHRPLPRSIDDTATALHGKAPWGYNNVPHVQVRVLSEPFGGMSSLCSTMMKSQLRGFPKYPAWIKDDISEKEQGKFRRFRKEGIESVGLFGSL